MALAPTMTTFNIDGVRGTFLLGSEIESCYVGDVLHGKRHGYGCYTYPNRFFRYEGQYKNGLKHGAQDGKPGKYINYCNKM